MFEDEVNGFMQEINLKAKPKATAFLGYLMVEDEGLNNFEELKRILDRMGVKVREEDEKGLTLEIEVMRDETDDIRFWNRDEELDFHHFYFVLRRNGLIRIDTLQLKQ